ncbi:3-oxoacyl-ACP synthase [Streptomyces sp. NPDC127108]|uniref:3-oxoacyl-ACP synthase n=1 Tax=Streptomyces sp. NPDC127108 TaxID=3345361 RepID=UPI00363C917E
MTAAPPVTIGHVGTWFPDTVRTLDGLTDGLPAAQRGHARALGIDEVRVADGLTESDLAVRAAEATLRATGTEAAELDALLLVQGRAPQYLMASEATRVQHAIGAHRALVSGVGDLGCVSVSAAFSLGTALLRGMPGFRRVLVVATSKAAAPARYRPPMTIVGDGAAAVLLTTSEVPGPFELVDQSLRTDGAFADLFRIDYRDVPERDWAEKCANEPDYTFRLAVRSRKEFLALNEDLLRRNGLTGDDITTHLMQNLSGGAFGFWQEALDVPIDPVCGRNLSRYGHLGPVDVLLNMADTAPALAPGAHALVMNSSPVAAWSSWLVRRTAHPATPTPGTEEPR